MVWASKKAMFSFATELKSREISHRMYSGESDANVRHDLTDVNTNWKKYQVILYTTTITVGINFEELHFDRLFVYGSCVSSPVRDIFQATMRVRHLSEDRMYVYMQGHYFLKDRTQIQKKLGQIWNKVKCGTTPIDAYCMKHNQMGIWKVMKDGNVGRPLYTQDWLSFNHICNVEEENRSKLEYKKIFKAYLDRCNYRIYTSEQIEEID